MKDNTENDFKGFYKKSCKERLQIISKRVGLNKEDIMILTSYPASLTEEMANKMIENCVGIFSLPMGIAPNFIINNEPILIPMVTEEPSVIAGASKAAKIAAIKGGFVTESSRPLMIGQIQLCRLGKNDTKERLQNLIKEHRQKLIEIAKESDPVLYQMGGGFKDIWVKELDTKRGEMYIIEFSVDVKDAMGANAINTIAEAFGKYIQNLVEGKIILRILSNSSLLKIARAKAKFDPNEFGGQEIVENILDAHAFAEADPLRAVTHNKGIMNGIIALTLATGNDTRAVEAAIHSYSAKTGSYSSLTNYYKDSSGCLVGEIEIPVPFGTVGGITNYHPGVKVAKKILNLENRLGLGEVAAALGLAQNFAALLALCGKGIQDAHMKLHQRKENRD